jgi:hypothetical protein
MEDYKDVHSGHGHGVLWQKKMNKKDKIPSPIATTTQERQPSNAFHPATAEQSFEACLHDFNHKTKTEN